MSTLHIMSGLPGSGKSTTAWNVIVQYARGGTAWLSLDGLRGHPKTQVWPRLAALPEWERICLNLQEVTLEAVLRHGDDAVIDNTHLWPEQLVPVVDVVHMAMARYGVPMPRFIVHDLTHVSLEEAINRNARRKEWVHPEVIWELHHKHQEARATGWRLTPEWLEEQSA